MMWPDPSLTSTTSANNIAVTYCGRCGMRMYRSQDGSHYRCKFCDDGLDDPR